MVRQAEDDSKQVTRKIELIGIDDLPAGEVVIAMIAPKRKTPVPLFIVETGTKNEAVEKALEADDVPVPPPDLAALIRASLRQLGTR